ncbi:hypothetical protein [Gordonia zhaorongruii]|uniref:hypothetical protein n=1 Tax=Gordonia zhaorongruii TaxID=2597659 RepID=UPI00104CE693|nr:hypothetical protein [Gordonia zhaorongruii]
MKSRIRLSVAAVAASAALVGGVAPVLVAPVPVATAAPSNDSSAAKRALDSIAPQPHDAADVVSNIQTANAVLKKLGITPFTPTLGACTDFTFPMAVGGAMPGPNTPILGDMTYKILGKDVDLNAVRKGEILYGFVPAGTFDDSADKKGMQVAWFNVDTFKGGLAEPMGGLTDTILDAVEKRIAESGLPSVLVKTAIDPLKKKLNEIPSNGVRGGLVETEQGTVLSAIYGTVKKGDATCYFFPSMGIATAK